MTDYKKIPDLVTEKISQTLADNLKNHINEGRVWLNKNMTYWVSADGNDGNADGSESKPFATLEAALQFVQKFVFNPYYQISIDFLTDYEDPDLGTGYHDLARNMGAFAPRWMKIQNSKSKTVKLNRINTYDGVVLWIRDVSLVSQHSACINATYGGKVYLQGQISTHTAANATMAGGNIVANKCGVVMVANNTVINASTELTDTMGIIYCTDGGIFCHQYTGNTNLTINVLSDFNAVFKANASSRILNLQKCVVNNDDHNIAFKARIAEQSTIFTSGRGNEWIPGDDIYIDASSQFL